MNRLEKNNMENLIANQKKSKIIMNLFIISFLLMPIMFFKFKTSKDYIDLFYFLSKVNFITLIVSGVMGSVFTIKSISEIEDDVLNKIKFQFPDLKIIKVGYNLFHIETISKNNDINGIFKINQNSKPTEKISIDKLSKTIFYN